MSGVSHDPRDIPILTQTIEQEGTAYALIDAKAAHAAVVSESLKLADTLLNQAARDIEAILFERVLDRLRAELPELVDRVLRDNAPSAAAAKLAAAAPPADG